MFSYLFEPEIWSDKWCAFDGSGLIHVLGEGRAAVLEANILVLWVF
jgi:hypothetical protein